MNAVGRRIAVLTGTRADYGLLRGLLRELDADPRVVLQLIVSGTHLSPEHGLTSVEITADGFIPAATVPIWSGDDSPLGAAVDTGRATAAYAQVLDELQPDLAVVLGDRLEAIAFALAATALTVPIAHIHGGEVTEGAMDDSLRHAITKLSTLHLVTTSEHARRVVQLGESRDRVFEVGAPIVDAVHELDLLPADEVARRFGVRFGARTALVTFHPAAFDVAPATELVEAMLDALVHVDGLHVIITGSNSDVGSGEVRDRIAAFVAAHPDRADSVESFGQLGYLSAMTASDVVVGNSSSTVLEAPVLGTPSVLIGDRQKGRPLSPSVRTPAPDRAAIAEAVREALASPADPSETPFGGAGFAQRAAGVLAGVDIPTPRKVFHDLPGESDL